MGGLTFGLYLGANTVPAAIDVCRALETATGEPIDFDPDRAWPEREREIHAGTASIVWACGLLTSELLDSDRPDLDIVAAPVFAGRAGATYSSVVIARTEGGIADLASAGRATLAVNGTDSWSGYHALRVLLMDRGLAEAPVARVLQTGSHHASIDAVRDGRADLAAIDDTIWEARLAADRSLDAIAVIDRTPAWPAPPFSVSRTLGPDLRAAIRAALLGASARGLDAIVPAAASDYRPMRDGSAASRRLAW